MSNEEPQINDEQQASSQEAQIDYSQPLFDKKPISLYTVLSCIIFIMAGAVSLLTNAEGNNTLLASIILMALGVGLLVLAWLRSRGQGLAQIVMRPGSIGRDDE